MPADLTRRSIVLGPAAHELRRHVGPTAWVVLEELLQRSTSDGDQIVAPVSIRSLGSSLGLAKDTVARAVRRLRELGAIEAVQARATSGAFDAGSYRITVPAVCLSLVCPPQPPVVSSSARPSSAPSFFSRQVAWWEPPVDDADRRARDAQRATLRTENRRRTAAIGAELDMVPRFALPDRTYYLMAGPVAAVAGLRDPSTGHWLNPDLFWPDDRRWFVATDVDFWSLYVGGSNDLIAELARSVITPTEIVTLADQLDEQD